MQSKKLRLISEGSNSQIFSFGEGESQVILKVVPKRSKEAGHLRNEWDLLQQLQHDSVVKAIKYQENVHFPGNDNNS